MKTLRNQFKLKTAMMILLIGFLHNAHAQNPAWQNTSKIGAGAELYSSGNSHGALYSIYVNFKNEKNNVYLGPVIQKRTMTIQGAKIGYSRILTGDKMYEYDDGELVFQRFQLNAFGYFQFVKDMPLGYGASVLENQVHRASDYNWSNIKLTTAEFCMGFEFHVKINSSLSWKNSIGISVFNHLNYVHGMYEDKMAPVLMIGTGINIKQFKKQ